MNLSKQFFAAGLLALPLMLSGCGHSSDDAQKSLRNGDVLKADDIYMVRRPEQRPLQVVEFTPNANPDKTCVVYVEGGISCFDKKKPTQNMTPGR